MAGKREQWVRPGKRARDGISATTGNGLSTSDMGTGAGTVSGGGKVTFTNPIVAAAATQLATHERQHVEFLRSTIAAA